MSCPSCFWRVVSDGPCDICRARSTQRKLEAENARLRARLAAAEETLEGQSEGYEAHIHELETRIAELEGQAAIVESEYADRLESLKLALERIARLEAEPTDEECHTFAGKYHGTVGIKEGVRDAIKWWV